jgi:hypothetical protein
VSSHFSGFSAVGLSIAKPIHQIILTGLELLMVFIRL